MRRPSLRKKKSTTTMRKNPVTKFAVADNPASAPAPTVSDCSRPVRASCASAMRSSVRSNGRPDT